MAHGKVVIRLLPGFYEIWEVDKLDRVEGRERRMRREKKWRVEKRGDMCI